MRESTVNNRKRYTFGVMKTDEIFASGKMSSVIWKMAVPAIAAQLVNLLYSIVDRIYIGHIPDIGTTALAGVGVCNAIIILISAFAMITGGGCAPLASIALGSGRKKRASQMMNNGFVIIMVLGVILMVIFGLTIDPMLRLVGASDATLPYAHTYLSIYLLGTLFVMAAIGMNPFLNVQGHPGLAMSTVILGAVLNIVLDPVFMFGFGMGVAGAAWATILSQFASALWIILFLVSKKASLRLCFADMKPNGEIMHKIFALGISPFVMASTESIIGFVMNGILVKYGDLYVSVLTIMSSCMQMIAVPLNGFQNGASPVISYNYGHGSPDRVKEGFKVIFLNMTLFNCFMSLMMIFFPGFFAALFTSDATLIAGVKKAMPLFMAGMTVFGMQRACQTMFVALNQPGVSLFIALLRKIFLLVPLAFLFSHFFGAMGVFGAEAAADAFAAITCILLFRHIFPGVLQKMKAQQA